MQHLGLLRFLSNNKSAKIRRVVILFDEVDATVFGNTQVSKQLVSNCITPKPEVQLGLKAQGFQVGGKAAFWKVR